MNTTIKNIIKNYPRLTEEQTKELCNRIKKGDVEARNTLALSNVGLIYEVMDQMHVFEQDKEDMFEECFIEYLEKMNRYDPTKGKFSTFFFIWLKDRIKRCNTLGMPVRLIQHNSRLKRIEEFYIQVYDRLPTEQELLEDSGFTKKVFNNIKNDCGFFYKDSLDRPLTSEDNASTLGELLECSNNSEPEDMVVEQLLEEELYDCMDQLTQRQRIVIDALYNLSGQYEKPLSLREIQNVTGIGRGTAANDRDAALSKLKDLFENGSENSYLAA